MAGRGPLVLILSILLTSIARSADAGSATADDTCRKDALSQAGTRPEAYAPRRGGYCDGVVFEAHSGSGELTVIGISASGIAGDPSSGPVRIAAAAAIEGASTALRLQGVAKAPEINYRLDAKLDPGQSLVLDKESALTMVQPHLRAEDVAWLAWSDSAVDGRIYTPTTLAGAGGSGVEIIVRPTIDTTYSILTIERPSANGASPKTLRETARSAGQPIAFGVTSETAGILRINILAVGYDGTTQTANIRLRYPKHKAP
ncbi:MAG TPA: hypothetical protein VGR62_16160 [Candidatus Binatia bacterium]|jgi:hypothetical protein|nr:hypothetical protein [Candidatus Binatia bacterium]